MKALGKITVSDPRWSTRRARAADCCSCSLGAWARESNLICFENSSTLKTTWLWFYIIPLNRGGPLCNIHAPPDVFCDSFACHVVAHVLTFNKNLLAQATLDAAGDLFMHQQEQRLTIWFFCCLGLGRWGSWLKAVERKWLIRKETHTLAHRHLSVTMVTSQWTSCLDNQQPCLSPLHYAAYYLLLCEWS